MTRTWLHRLGRLITERRGSVGPMLTLMLVPIIGAIGMATESSSWFFMKRAAQNAADAAVLAAASNGSATAPTYVQEAQSVAANYGFTNGAGNVAVTAINTATCPAPSTATNCYQVTVTKKVQIALTTLVGYSGDTTVNGEPAVQVSASAIASAPIPVNDCIVTKTSFQTNGAPKFDAGGCDLYSNGSATCNASGGLTGLGFGGGFAVGTDKKCGSTPVSTAAPDPYSGLLTTNPQTGCHPVTSPSSGGTTLDWSSFPCVTIASNFTVPAGTTTVKTDTSSANKGTVLVITGGKNIALNGTLTAAFGQGLTVVFTGASGGAGFITGSGTIDFGAPTSGPWSGIALYQDPVLTTVTSPTYSGSSPTFNVTGLVYAPYANMTFSGAINHETGGYACLSFYLNSLLINGTGSIFANPASQCVRAGLTGLPAAPNTVAVRQALVQ